MNCGFKVNPTVKVTLTSNCTNPPCHKENVQLIYQWTLFIQSTLNASWTRVDQLESVARTTLNSSSLVINPNTLLPGRNYRLKVALDNAKGESSSGFSVWRFTTFSIPSGGVCTANLSTGVAVQETFTLTCTGWQGPNQPLLYEFMIALAQGTSTILSYGYSSVAEITLPPGDPLKNYSLTIDVYIIGSMGSRTKTTIKVQVGEKAEDFCQMMLLYQEIDTEMLQWREPSPPAILALYVECVENPNGKLSQIVGFS